MFAWKVPTTTQINHNRWFKKQTRRNEIKHVVAARARNGKKRNKLLIKWKCIFCFCGSMRWLLYAHHESILFACMSTYISHLPLNFILEQPQILTAVTIVESVNKQNHTLQHLSDCCERERVRKGGKLWNENNLVNSGLCP